MNREYHKWRSAHLGRDMELLVYGHGGAPLLVFPTSMKRFFEYEDGGMVATLRDKFESGHLQAFCVDSVDTESWYNKGIHPRDRVLRHEAYERYLLDEVVPLIASRGHRSNLGVTGCSFGGYHSFNFAFRNPDLVSRCISISGAADIRQFLDGYYDEHCYFNNPADYVANMSEGWYLDRIRSMQIVLATGEYDICRGENERMSAILSSRGIPHNLDIWGDGAAHDWPWWRGMARKFL